MGCHRHVFAVAALAASSFSISVLAGGREACPGDLDGSGAVDGTDLAILLGDWGPCPAKGPCPADLTGNGAVDGADLSILLGAWGACPSGCDGAFAWDGELGVPGVNQVVRAFEVIELGDGPRLFAGGGFTASGGTPVGRVAQWDGTTWSEVGGGVNNAVRCFASFDDGTGLDLYVGGSFTAAGGVEMNRIARWDGSAWSPLESGFVGSFVQVNALRVFDDGAGPALYAGGSFSTAGGEAAPSIAKWDGSVWSAIGGTDGIVNALAVFDDGTGPALYAGGFFFNAGGAPASRIAKWDGSTWSPLGEGVGGAGSATVNALAVFDDGSGPALYAGGTFTSAGGTAANRIAKWDGGAWSTLAGGVDGTVTSLAVFDDGTGPALYVGGTFTNADGLSASRIARWDGTTWSALGEGIGATFAGPRVDTLAVIGDGDSASLIAGGLFDLAGGASVGNVATWGCVEP
ncbi:MAG: hypothetical protein RLZZ565_255 [Planctomycetota bacterium]